MREVDLILNNQGPTNLLGFMMFYKIFIFFQNSLGVSK